MKPLALLARTAAVAAMAMPLAASSQTSKDLVGVWVNTSNVNIAKDGARTNTFGPKGTGRAIFTDDGHFVIVNINPDTPKFAANTRAGGTVEENKAAVAGGIGLFGTYSVSGRKVTMKVEGSTYPNWTGTDQTRDLTIISPDEWKWTLAASVGGQGEVSWKRLK